MAISDKLNYLIETKSQLKDMINYGLPTENQITNETTFRNYVKGIFEAFLESLRDSTTLYTNLPKISGNGTQITLNDTANAPIRITLGSSALSQDGTPTPDTPQDIHTISGDNSVVVRGKNLFSGEIVVEGKTISDTGAYATNVNYNIYRMSNLEGNTTYTISENQIYSVGSAGTAIRGVAYNSNNQVLGLTFYQNRTAVRKYSYTFTTPANTSYILAQFRITDTEIMLEKGSTATTYTPYVSQTAPINLGEIEYCKIGDYEDEFILTSGKNKLDIDTFKNLSTFNTYETHNNIECLKLVGRTITYNLNCKENTQYTFQFKYIDKTTADIGIFQFLYSDGTASDIRYSGQMTTSGTIYSATSTANKTITGIKWDAWNAGNSIYIDKNSMQLEKGSTATSYEPYGTNQWYLKKNIGKVVLDGSENIFTESTNIPNEYRFKIDTGLTNIYREPNTSAISPIFCSICKSISRYQTSANIQGICYGIESDYYKDFVIYLDLAKNMTPQDFKNWLASNNVTIYYVLNTPTYTQITGTLETQLENIYKKLLSYKGTTNISQVNNDLPFVLGVSAIQDLE